MERKVQAPKGHATFDYQEPLHDELLWIYEGLTQYYGWLLATRSGIESVQDAKDELATIASALDTLSGRQWRPLGPAARAGLQPGATVVAVNGRKYAADVLRKAIAASKGADSSIELLTERDGLYRTCRVSWNQGGRYPHLERNPTKPDLLAAILAPRARAGAADGKR
ncbi:hypothetical protein [Pendulispora albinea]|uniref:Peptidase M61 catalytic domain-containing protein n=1 Tax=Pendulispora albinea TaxID=2741071 RepID=A0ABZ2MBD4_9BACT